jgi:hypothetical protein
MSSLVPVINDAVDGVLDLALLKLLKLDAPLWIEASDEPENLLHLGIWKSPSLLATKLVRTSEPLVRAISTRISRVATSRKPDARTQRYRAQ